MTQVIIRVLWPVVLLMAVVFCGVRACQEVMRGTPTAASFPSKFSVKPMRWSKADIQRHLTQPREAVRPQRKRA